MLIAYASLYPFSGWRLHPQLDPLSYLWLPWPRYWTGFDLVANLLGYAPLGFLLALGAMRDRVGRGGVALALLAPAVYSLLIETTQNFLPMRVPSNVDLGLNAAGGTMGAFTAMLLERMGGLQRWSAFRAAWFHPTARASLILLALWPVALLYPTSIPFALGQVARRIEAGLADMLAGTPFLAWLPAAPVGAQMSQMTESICVGLGLWVPVCLGYADIPSVWRRLVFAHVVLALGLAAVSLSTALSLGPEHAWSWLSPPALLGFAMAWLLSMGALAAGRRLAIVFMLLALAVTLSLINQAGFSPYLAQSVEVWEQGRFIRFYGLSQWLGALWPFVALVFGVFLLGRPGAPRA
ncbi:VanZ family protein [Hydrogenophaga sp. 5NK40-0174]